MKSDLMQHRMVRRPEVEQVTGLSRATLYRLIAEGQFPGPVRLTGGNAVGWRAGDIRAWLESREPAIEVPEHEPDTGGGDRRRGAPQSLTRGEASDGSG